MSAAWVSALRARLARAFDGFDAAVRAAPPAALAPGAGSAWSVLDVAEHAARTHRFLLILVDKIGERCIRRAARGAVPPAGPPDLDALERLGRGETRWAAPEHMLPTRTADLETIRAELAAQRGRCLGWLDRMPRGEGRLHTLRMSAAGPDARLDLYGFLCVIVLHLERHERQVRRIAAAQDW